MNEPTPLEKQLQSWTLRRPSAEVRARIFAAAESEPQARPRFSLAWAVPVTLGVIALVASLSVRPYSSANFGVADTNLFFASVTLNSVTSLQSQVSDPGFNLSKSDMNLEQNVWRTATLASTNHDQSHSSMGSLPSGNTNSLIR